jgi:hypothetical protein
MLCDTTNAFAVLMALRCCLRISACIEADAALVQLLLQRAAYM